MKKSIAALVAAAALCASTAFAVPTSFVVPNGSTSPFDSWSLGAANSVHAQWEVFTDAYSTPGNAPDVAGSFPASGSSSGASSLLVGNTAGAFLTGGGNIYSFSAPTSFTVTVPNYNLGAGWNSRFVAQIQNQGSLLDFTSVLLSYDGGNQLLAPTYSHELLGGAIPENLFAWDLAGFNPSTYSLTFKASASSMSLDAIAVDTYTQTGAFTPMGVPEPATAALAAIGLVGSLAVRRNSRRS
ncbi:PEP-CTERM sorting domain-containing protein [Lacipirellula sp.]|uniref:PEP-CTERM sorting domain-containing protein n=1 Tax=Lacipirellula sp. TaxID=2691419 RepID=UPI003D13C84B